MFRRLGSQHYPSNPAVRRVGYLVRVTVGALSAGSILILAAGVLQTGTVSGGNVVGTDSQPTTPANTASPEPTNSPQPTPTLAYNTCRLDGVEKWVSPDEAVLGEQVTVTLRITGDCSDVPPPVQVILALDAAADMDGTWGQQMRAAAECVIRGLNLPLHPLTEVAVLQYNDSVRVLSPLSNDRDQVLARLGRVRYEGGRDLAAALAESAAMLRAGRARSDYPDDLQQFVIAFAGGADYECDPAIRESGKLAESGVIVSTVCVTPDCDVLCIKDVATSPRYFYYLSSMCRPGHFTDPVPYYVTGRLLVTDTLGTGLEHVPGSAEPSTIPLSDTLTWDLQSPGPPPQRRLTYMVRANRVGLLPVNKSAELRWVAGRSVLTATFPVPMLRVHAPSSSTPSAESSPTPTGRPTAVETEARPTATRTEPAEPTAPAGVRVFLPWATLRQPDGT